MNIRIFHKYRISLSIWTTFSIVLVMIYLKNNSNELEQTPTISQIVKDSLQEIFSRPTSMVPFTQIKEKVVFKAAPNIIYKNFISHQNHSIRNSQMGPFEVQVTREERQMMYHLLEVFDKIMKKHKITYFMCSGTLLGSFRHHDLIPWDDDIDLFVPFINHTNMEEIFKPFSPEYLFHRAGVHDKFHHKSSKRASKYDWSWPYVDISYYIENDTHIINWAKVYGVVLTFPKSIVFPLHNRPLSNLSLPAPKDTFAYLVTEYKNGSQCVMSGYSHMVEGFGPIGKVECKTLSDRFPFVEHFPDVNGIREVLKYKDKVISDIVVPEPRYAVAETFAILLKPGYEMPKEIFDVLS